MPSALKNPPHVRQLRLSADDVVVIVFAVVGLVGSVVLVLSTNTPQIMISFLFSTGVTSLIYRYLGGVQGTSFKVGALKLTGTVAFLVGLGLLIHIYLVDQQPKFRLIKDDVIAGSWHWVYA